MNDPIVEQVRKHRMEHTLKFGGDLKAICEDLQKIQKASGHLIVRLQPIQESRDVTQGGTK